jgi:hypothetical protein
MSARSCSGSGMRTRRCGWSGRSCEKRRSSSRGRTTGGRRGVLVDRRGEDELSRRCDVPRARRQPDRLPQLGAPGAVGSGAHRRVVDREDQADPRCQPWRVRGAEDPRRAADGARRRRGWKAGRAVDESGRYLGRHAPEALEDDDPDPVDHPGLRSRRAAVPAGSSKRAVGRGHHLSADRRGLALFGRGPGRVLPADRRLGDGDAHARTAGRRRAADGARSPASAAWADPSFRPGLAGRIHLVVATLDEGGLRWAGRWGGRHSWRAGW